MLLTKARDYTVDGVCQVLLRTLSAITRLLDSPAGATLCATASGAPPFLRAVKDLKGRRL